MCGLAGFSGKGTAGILKLRTLGEDNIDRGTDSYGIHFDGNTEYGVGSGHAGKGNFRKDTRNKKLKFSVRTTENNSVLMHTRNSSVGVVNKANAHPFDYYDVNGNLLMSFMHNGTLKDWGDLAKEYGYSKASFGTDSEMLGEIILTHGYDVFSKYYGGAACAFTSYEENQGINLFLWRGESKRTHHSQTLSEERPLFYAKFPEGVYFSSLEESLDVIGNYQYTVHEVPANTLLHFKDGKLVEETEIDRSERNQTGVYVPYVRPETNSTIGNTYSTLLNQDEFSFELNPQNLAKGRIYFFKGKYWRNGHIAKGEFHLMPDGAFTHKDNVQAKPFYFYDGIMLRDRTRYTTLLENGTSKKSYIRQMHPDMLIYSDKTDSWFYGGELPKRATKAVDCSVVVPFGYQRYYFDKDSKLARVITLSKPSTGFVTLATLPKPKELELPLLGGSEHELSSDFAYWAAIAGEDNDINEQFNGRQNDITSTANTAQISADETSDTHITEEQLLTELTNAHAELINLEEKCSSIHRDVVELAHHFPEAKELDYYDTIYSASKLVTALLVDPIFADAVESVYDRYLAGLETSS